MSSSSGTSATHKTICLDLLHKSQYFCISNIQPGFILAETISTTRNQFTNIHIVVLSGGI